MKDLIREECLKELKKAMDLKKEYLEKLKDVKEFIENEGYKFEELLEELKKKYDKKKKN